MRSKRTRPNSRNRRAERSRAFQILYGLLFHPADSPAFLSRHYALSPYTEPCGADGTEEPSPQPEARDASEPAENCPPPADACAGSEKTSPLPALPELSRYGDEDRVRIITPEPGERPEGFAWILARGAWLNRARLDELIAGFSQHWRVERMGRPELSLLRLALQELLFHDDTPPKVIINEAMELSRQFGDAAARSFINGILDAAVKALESGRLQRAPFIEI
jgi:transcription antitermination factor NusB